MTGPAETARNGAGTVRRVNGPETQRNAAQPKTGPNPGRIRPPATVAALCAGYGGLELAARTVWPNLEVAWFAETDPHAAGVFAAHHPNAPNLGDLTRIDGKPPAVDLVTAGFPCQPVSVAGKRNGIHDERWLIDDICRIARAARARLVILENVRGILTANDGKAIRNVRNALNRNGYTRIVETVLSAAEIGAPHKRARWFAVATTDADRW